MLNYLFIIFPAAGHLNSILKAIKDLSRLRDAKIHFMETNNAAFNSQIKLNGFQLVACKSVPIGLPYFEELSLYKNNNKGFSDLLKDHIDGGNQALRLREIKEVLEQYAITNIVIDSFIGADALLYYDLIIKRKLSLSFITTLSPYMRSKEFSNPLHISEIIYRLKGYFYYLYSYLFLVGQTRDRLLKKLMLKQNVNLKVFPVRSQYISVIEGHKEFVLSPKCMISYRNNIDCEYLGLCVDSNRPQIVEKEDKEEVNKILDSGKRIVYISFGTLYHQASVKKLLDIILKLANLFKSHHFIIGNLGNTLKNMMNLKINHDNVRNISFFGTVPQLSIMSKSEIFIGHGGFNSIKEAIYYNLPMIIIPIKRNSDQFANAKYVCLSGIGLSIPYEDITLNKITNGLKNLISNKTIKNNLYDLRVAIREEMMSNNTFLQ